MTSPSHRSRNRLQDAFVTVRNLLCVRDHSDIVLFEYGFVVGAVIAVAGKPVKFSDEDDIE